MKRFVGIFLISIFSVLPNYAQNLDSLWQVYNNKSQPDTNRLKAIKSIAWSYRSNNPDTAIILAEQELQLAQATKQKVYEAGALNIIGVSYMFKSNYPKALEYYLKSLKLTEGSNNRQGLGVCYMNIGNIYNYQSNYAKATEYYFKALKITEETNDKKNTGRCYGNIGLLYYYQSDYLKAIDFQLKSFKIFEELHDKKGMGNSYINLGEVYKFKADLPKALDYFLKALKNFDEVNDKQGKGSCYVHLGELYSNLSDYKLAIKYSDWALINSKEIDDIEHERLAYENLAIAYSKTGKYKEAYENHVKFKTLTDSIFNEENSKQLGDMKTQFEVEKKEAELKIKSDAEQEKLKAIANEEKKRQQVIIASVGGVLVLVIIFSLFLYKRFKITQRQKVIIEKQKVMVDKAYEELHERNKEVMDSIRYAKRIQTALITTEKYIENTFNKLMKKDL